MAESCCAGHCVGAADLTWVVSTWCLHVPSAVAVGSALQPVQNCACMSSIGSFSDIEMILIILSSSFKAVT